MRAPGFGDNTVPMEKTDAGRLAGKILLELGRPEASLGVAEPLAYKLLERLAAQTRALGVALEHDLVGPWQVGETVGGLGRFVTMTLPTVERGEFALLVGDAGRAVEIASFLNWCEVPEPCS